MKMLMGNIITIMLKIWKDINDSNDKYLLILYIDNNYYSLLNYNNKSPMKNNSYSPKKKFNC